MNYSVPGVYVQEISTLPRSVAGVATAIPAFVGYTEKALDEKGSSFPNSEIVVQRIDTFLEYEQFFGANPRFARFTLEAGSSRYEFKRKIADGSSDAPLLHSHLMYYALRMYFDNGGGSCYIVSVARYNSDATSTNKIESTEQENELIKKGLDKLQEFDEPTLIVLPDAINLAADDYYSRCVQVLNQCNLLKDRFGIFDVLNNDGDAADFRLKIGGNYLKYGAAYTPFLKSSISYKYKEHDVEVGAAFWQYQSDANGKTGIKILYPDLNVASIVPRVTINANSIPLGIEVNDRELAISGIDGGVTTVANLMAVWNGLTDSQKGSFVLSSLDDSATLSAEEIDVDTEFLETYTNSNGLRVINSDAGASPTFTIAESGNAAPVFTRSGEDLTLTVKTGGDSITNVLAAWTSYVPKGNFLLEQAGDGSVNVGATASTPVDVAFLRKENSNNGLQIDFKDSQALGIPKVRLTNGVIDFSVTDDEMNREIIISGAGSTAQDIVDAWNSFGGEKGGFALLLDENADGSAIVNGTTATAFVRSGEADLASIKESFTQMYNQLKADLVQQRVILPPSSSMAGIYASVDRDRGVWKAPANVSIASLIEPTKKITNAQQGRLNIDPTSGKSINVIRSFTGRGTLVWGARTLAGNDNEWRYINVRRLFTYMEESIQKATAFTVFEANTATTWLKVKGLIESFLYGLWQQGALAGPTPEAAYFVNVGLGKTMTPQDVLEGKLIVEIGVAAVRPAEFIILRFMHKLQEA